jgi:TonB family protein
MSWSEPREDHPAPLVQSDLIQTLEQKIAEGFPPGLALDLVLNELVVRAAIATRASAGALALARDGEMVCRAATGDCAPDLGVPLNTRHGVSGACLGTGQSQFCRDTESDPRVDAAASRHLGIRSMLVVPVRDGSQLVGVLEVFSPSPEAFLESDQVLLESYARECTQIQRAALELEQRPAAPGHPAQSELDPFSNGPASPLQKTRSSYETWTLALGALAILSAAGLSFMIGSRLGWLRTLPPAAPSQTPPSIIADSGKTAAPQAATAKQPAAASEGAGPSSSVRPAPPPSVGGLVVYDQGKVIFRMKPAPLKPAGRPAKMDSGNASPGKAARVWLAPDLAEGRLRYRIEPKYPTEAIAAHRTGDVVLEVLVSEDGAVVSIQTRSGDPLLAGAATDAVRNWRYEPYRVQDRPAPFQTDVTLKFALPD